MTKDDLLSKKLSEMEESKKHYLARQVEWSDRGRVGAAEVETASVPDAGTSSARASEAGEETETLVTGVPVHGAPVTRGVPHSRNKSTTAMASSARGSSARRTRGPGPRSLKMRRFSDPQIKRRHPMNGRSNTWRR